MDLVWFAITPHVPVLSPACKLLPSKESPSVLGDGASPIGQEASSASKERPPLPLPPSRRLGGYNDEGTPECKLRSVEKCLTNCKAEPL